MTGPKPEAAPEGEPIEPTKMEKLHALPWSVVFDVATTFFAQFTFFGSVFVLFLDALRLSKSQIGFLLSLFPFFGLISLFIMPQVGRSGYKRTFLTWFGLRTVITAGLMFTPLFAARFTSGGVLLFVSGITIAFAISRAVAMTALLPWQQEYIPNEVRGKYSAYSNIFVSLSGILAVSVAGYLLGREEGLNGYVILFGLGVFFGLLATYLASFIPGGAAAPTAPSAVSRQDGFFSTFKDRSFQRYLLGVGLLTLGTGPMLSFLPLYMQGEVGLSPGNVVLLQTGTLIGSLLTSFLWGWMADRYGSRPVMLSGLFLNITLPVWWLIMPRMSSVSLYVALAIALLQGIASVGWAIGSGRFLYVNLIPNERKLLYLSQYNAWVGLIGGISALLGGQLLDSLSGFQTELVGLPVGPYTILFAIGFFIPLIASLLLGAIPSEGEISVGKFAGLFLHGNPLLAAESLVRYHFARSEPAAVSVTARLGQARSPLTVEELLEALQDPRFFVRYEAVISIARHSPDERLVNALMDILNGNDPAMIVAAAWALGRLGDPRASRPLRESLYHRYRSVQAHAARSLAVLGDQEAGELILERMAGEQDLGLQIAFSSALGRLGVKPAAPQMLRLLGRLKGIESRNEVALALARLVGDEDLFIQLLRSVRQDPGTAMAQELSSLRRKLSAAYQPEDELLAALDASLSALAQHDLESGAASLAGLIQTLPEGWYCDPSRLILEGSAGMLSEHGSQRMEVLVLAVYTLQKGLEEPAG